MKEIPPELRELLNNRQLPETVAAQPGRRRFKAAVMGLAALKYLKDQKQTGPREGPEKQ